MLLTNHVMTGAAIALTVNDPIVAAPTAFASHFVLDSIPHFGAKGASFKQPKWFLLGTVDCLVSFSIYLFLIAHSPQHFWLITIGMFFAALPDLFYIPETFFNKRLDPAWFRKFHGKIQIELPRGILVEIIWATIMITVLRGKL
jgi:hypothetical protein